MNKKAIKCLFILMIAPLMVSFSWPQKSPRITSTFGESRGDHFHDGIDTISNDTRIYAPQEGKLLYYWDQSIYPLDNEPGAGNYSILKHDDKVTMYLHLQSGVNTSDLFSEGDVLGRMGNTGHSYGNHLHFSVFKDGGAVSVNPLSLLSSLDDVKAPEIIGFFMRINDKYISIRDNSDIRLTNHHPLLVRIVDSAMGGERLGVAKFTAWANGIKAADHVFNEVILRDGRGYIGDYAFEDVFDDIGYYKLANIKYK